MLYGSEKRSLPFQTLDPEILNKFIEHLLEILIVRLDEMNIAMAAFKKDFEKMYRHL
jgi:hypothetical protein